MFMCVSCAYHFTAGRARGVLTVTVSGNPPEKKSEYDGKKMMVIWNKMSTMSWSVVVMINRGRREEEGGVCIYH